MTHWASKWIAMAALVTLIGASCVGRGQSNDGRPVSRTAPGSPGDISGEISFMSFGDPEELKAYRELISAFEEAEPDVTVKFIEASDRDDLIARLATAFSGGVPPDLFLMNYRYYAQFHVKDVLQPLQPYLDASQAFQTDDFYPQAMEAFQVNGQQICMPQNISSLVVYYNKDLFDEAGIEEPREGWTWGEFVQTAQALTKDTDGDGATDQYGVVVDPEVIRLAPFIWSNGGELFDREKNPTRFALNNRQALEAMAEFFKLSPIYGINPPEEELEAEDGLTRFLNGTLGMILSSRRDTPTFRTVSSFEWNIAALPRHEKPAGILHSDAYCLVKESDNKAAAWRFVEFALGEGAPIIAASGRTVPSLIEVARSKAFLDPDVKPTNSRVFLDAIPSIRRIPTISTWPEIEDSANAIIEDAFFEGESPEEIAGQLIEITKPIFERAEQ